MIKQEILPNFLNVFLNQYCHPGKIQSRLIETYKKRIIEGIILPVIQSKEGNIKSNIEQFIKESRKVTQNMNKEYGIKSSQLDLEIYSVYLQKIK